MSNETDNIQADYEMFRPLFLRAIKNKTAQDVLQLFEQLRKNMKLNKSNINLNPEEKTAKLKEIKGEFYDGLMDDLMNVKGYQLA